MSVLMFLGLRFVLHVFCFVFRSLLKYTIMI